MEDRLSSWWKTLINSSMTQSIVLLREYKPFLKHELKNHDLNNKFKQK
jgi:hypothetical protein